MANWRAKPSIIDNIELAMSGKQLSVSAAQQAWSFASEPTS